MQELTFEKTTPIPCPGEELEHWHTLPGAFERLCPPWQNVHVVDDAAIENGNRTTLKVKIGPFWRRWIAEYREVKKGCEFTDFQVKGPFARWRHRHRFISDPQNPENSTLADEIHYLPPLSPLSKIFAGHWINRTLARSFTYRHAITREDIRRAQEHPAPATMRILVSGASGLIGNALIPYLKMRGHEILRLTRHARRQGDIEWDPETGKLDLSEAGKLDAVIHLAGENIAEGRWSSRKKERILSSRQQGTRLLCNALAAMPAPPQVLISASGINYYAKNPGATTDETSPVGTGFLSNVCHQWELGTLPAEQAGIRVCKLRIGMVLTPAGGALKKMLLPFRLGLGGRIGKGTQRTGWIAIDDLVDMIDRALGDKRWQGPVNAVAKEPASNRDFTRQLAKTLRRPAILPIPAFSVRLLFGEMVKETLLADLPACSGRLDQLDYQLRHPELAGALRHLLGSTV